MILLADSNADVRYRLAESYHLPKALLEMLADDQNPFVAARACKTLKRIEQSERGCDVRHLRTLSPEKTLFRMNLGG